MKSRLIFIVLAMVSFQRAAFSHAALPSALKADTIKRILILGNSITKHAPSPRIGWYGNWGMAASSMEKDFVHILEKRLQLQHPQVKVNFENISAFETGYWKYELSRLDSLKALNPDIVILRIGENVKQDSVEKYGFATYYNDLINYFTKGNSQVKIFSVSSFWKKDAVDQIMEIVSLKQNCSFIKLSHLSNDKTNMALGQFEHTGVANHPSDKGMVAIADAIWEAIQTRVKGKQ